MAQEEKEYIENRQIRIFISSTFKDMQEERKYLVNNIFPGLREYCKERDVSLFELDLRWGITQEDSENQRAFKICLDEVNRTKPFFIGLLGERYGWVPKEDEIKKMVDSKFLEEYPLVQEDLKRKVSITETEILEGALRPEESTNAFFYFRSPEKETPDEFREEKGSHEEKMLHELKKKIKKDKRYEVEEYSDIVELGGFVERDFKALIDEIFPENEIPSDFEKERMKQRVFLKSKTKVYAEDETLYKTLDEFIESEEKITAITGESGIGKTAFLANWISNRQNKNIKNENIIYHFNGISDKKYGEEEIIERILDEVYDIYKFPRKNEELHDLLLSSLPDNEELIIILDCNENISNIEITKLIEWIPENKKNVKVIFTALLDDKTIEILDKNNYRYIKLSTLSVEQRKTLIKKYYNSYNKKLLPEQVDKIAEYKLNENPFYLLLILNNLRIFGTHDKLNEQIEEYVKLDSYEDLINLFLTKIEESFNNCNAPKGMVKDILSLFMVLQYPLTESEIIGITKVPRLYWSQLYNNISEYMLSNNGYISISNDIMTNVIIARYLNDINTVEFYRKKYADFMEPYKYQKHSKNNIELPYQLYVLKEWDKLYNVILDHEWFICLYVNDKDGIINYWCTLLEIDKEKYNIKRYNENEMKLKSLDILRFYKNITSLLIDNLNEYSLGLEFALKYQFYDNNLFSKLNQIDILLMIGRCYIELEEYKKAIENYNKILELSKKWPKREQPELVITYMNIGICYFSLNKYDEAIKNLNEGLEINNKINSITDIEKYNIYDKIAVSYYRIEKYKKSIECCLKSIEVLDNNLDVEKFNFLYINPYCYMGFSYSLLKDYNNANIYYKKAMKLSENIYGKEHEETIYYYDKIGDSYFELDEYDNALEYYYKTFEIKKNNSNTENEELINSYKNISLCYYKLGNYQKALEYDKECYALQEKMLAKEDPDLISTISDIGVEYYKLENYQKALEYHIEALNLRLKIYKESHEDVAFSYKEVGLAYEALGEVEKAKEYFNKEKDISEQLANNEESEKNIEHNSSEDNDKIDQYNDQKEEEKDIIINRNITSIEEAINYIKDDPSLIVEIPNKLLNEEFYLEAIKYYPDIINQIPDELLTENIILNILKEKIGKELLWEITGNLARKNMFTNEICIFAIKNDGSCFIFIPDKFITKEIYFIAVVNSINTIIASSNSIYKEENIIICKKLMTIDTCEIEVIKNKLILKKIPEEFITYKLCYLAVKHHGLALEYVPEKLITEEICLIAAEQNGKAIKFVPEKFRTKEIYNLAVNHIDGFQFKDVPYEFITNELCIIAISIFGSNLEYVPNELKTLEICVFAINKDGCALGYVPDELKTLDICLTAINKDGCALEYVPDIFKTQEFCLIAIKNNAKALEFIPKNLRTKEFYLTAVTNNCLTLEYVPEKLKTIELCSVSVNQNYNMLEFVPEYLKSRFEKSIKEIIYPEKEMLSNEDIINKIINWYDYAEQFIQKYPLTQEICNELFKRRYKILDHMPDDFKTKEMCLAAIGQNFLMLHYVPKELLDFEIYMEAVKNNGAALAIVPDELITSEMCLIAVKSRGFVLFAVPKEFKTKEICIEAVKQNNAALEYVPEELVLAVKKAVGI